MARTLPVLMVAKVLDGLNVEALVTSYTLVDPGATFTMVITLLNEWLADIVALTDAQIVKAWLQAITLLPDGLNHAVVDTSRVEQTGVINFSADGTNRRWAEVIPALSSSSGVVSGGKIVLGSGSPAQNLVDLMTTGGTADLEWTNDAQQALVSLKDTLISFRSYYRQTAASTYET